MMSFQARRELLAQVASRYREASLARKSQMLDEFVAVTGYARKYAISLLTRPVSPPPAPIRRPRAARYGPAVQEALLLVWTAANCICGKRLIPFLPELVAALERHGHFPFSEEIRRQLLNVSPATADRIFHRLRQGAQSRGLTTTRAGTLLKHQVPIRTFADWEENRPGFIEADLVAHCGGSVAGTFLNTLVLTDIATGWTECLPLLYRGQETVIRALTLARQLLPFPLLGLDTDNGSEFLNEQLLAYCREERITFTRGRAYRKNDQCHVEQKNGVVVRQLVGYDRYEGQHAYRQLAELYRAVRLYVNFFQPSMKLEVKQREGSKVTKRYAVAQTPYQRLLTYAVVGTATGRELEEFYAALDPVRLLKQVEALQDAFWRLAWGVGSSSEEKPAENSQSGSEAGAGEGLAALAAAAAARRGRQGRRGERARVERTWRTRPDPFAGVWEKVREQLEAEPERTAKSLLMWLQEQYPGEYGPGQLRTLQRRVQEWRQQALLAFDGRWLAEVVEGGGTLPGPLQATSVSQEEERATERGDKASGERLAAD